LRGRLGIRLKAHNLTANSAEMHAAPQNYGNSYYTEIRTLPEELLMRLGVARKQARTAWRLLAIEVAKDSATFSYRLDRKKLRRARRREGRHPLRTNLSDDDPARLWVRWTRNVRQPEPLVKVKPGRC
jgi:hypothetical protein